MEIENFNVIQEIHAMRILFYFLLFGLISCSDNAVSGHTKPVVLSHASAMKSLRAKAAEARAFCKQKGMDLSVAILIDMNRPSGTKRFVVWDFRRDTILMTGLVTHGCGLKKWGSDGSKNKPVFSNTIDSHCSSLGKYKIGNRGYSTWGIHVNYILYGLEKTNSNALARTVVLHSWDAVPNQETYPDGIAESWGCPAVSNDFMLELDKVLKVKTKPVLLWIYG